MTKETICDLVSAIKELTEELRLLRAAQNNTSTSGYPITLHPNTNPTPSIWPQTICISSISTTG